jgi:hypothetical protein
MMGRCQLIAAPFCCAMDKSLPTLKDELRAAVQDLDAAATQLRPRLRRDAWSIQQIVEHLLMTYEGTASAFRSRLAKGAATRKPASAIQRIIQTAIVTCGYFPPGRSAPEAVQPKATTESLSGKELSWMVEAQVNQLEELSNQAEVKFGSRRSVTHLLLGPMSMRQWRRFHLIHGRHHLKQIAAIRRDYKV